MAGYHPCAPGLRETDRPEMIKTLWSEHQRELQWEPEEGTPDHTAWREKLEGPVVFKRGRTWAEAWDEFNMRVKHCKVGESRPIQGVSPRKRRAYL